MPSATLINQQGQKVVVPTGSPEAQQYFSQGFQLMGPDGKPVGTSPGLTPAPAPNAVPAPTPAPNAPSAAGVSQTAPAPIQGAQQASGAPTAPVGLDIFGKVMGEIQDKLSDTAPIQAQKSALLKQLYDSPLSEQEMSALTPAQRDAIHSGNRNLIDLEVRLLNDNIKGRSNTLDQSMKYFTDTYQTNIQNLAQEKQKNFDNVMKMYDAGGSAAFKSMPEANKRAFEQANGLADGFLDTPSLSELQLQETARQHRASNASSGGGAFDFGPSEPAKPKQTFDEFLAAKEEEAGQSFSQARRDALRKEYDDLQSKEAPAVNYGDQFNALYNSAFKSVDAAKRGAAYFKSLLDTGDKARIEGYLNNLAKDSLSGTQKTNYDAMGSVYANTTNALNSISGLGTDFGPYKTALEKLKPIANVSKDQKWVSFVAGIQSAQSQYLNSIYGASLTDNELERANLQTIDVARDDIKTVETKLKGLRSLANEVRTRLVNEARGVYEEPKLDTGSTSFNATSARSKYNY